MRENHKSGLLNDILEFVENNIPYAKKLTPIIRKGGAPLIKEHVVPMITEWISKELDKVIKGKEGSGLDLTTISYVKDYLKRKQVKKIEIQPLTLGELEDKCKNIKYFRGVFMRTMLPEKVNKYDCGIVNLGSFDTNGTHCICYYKNDKIKYYFDSYGKQIDKPIRELVNYLGKDNIFFNDNQIQGYNDPPICGHLCVYVLNELSKNEDYKNSLYKLTLKKNE